MKLLETRLCDADMRRWIRLALTAIVVLIAVVLVLAFAAGPGVVERSMNRVTRDRTSPVLERIRRLHETLVIADLHDDLLLWGRDPLARSDRGHTDIPRLLDGGVALQVFSAVTKVPAGQNYQGNPADSDLIIALAILQRWPPRTWQSLTARATYQASRLHDAAARSNGRLSIVTTRAELDRFIERRSRDRNRLAGVLAVEGLHALDGVARNVDTLFRAGFRMMGLAHFFDNEVSGSAHGRAKGGLTPLGREVIQEMEQRGIIVDLAHASPRAFADALDAATRPIVVSHTGVQGTCPGPRNLTDDQIRRVAKNGGVIGIGFWDAAVCDLGAGAIVKAVRYAVDLAGVEHVALGSDFDGATTVPFDAAGLVQLTAALIDAGFTGHEVGLIMGENVVRLLGQALPKEAVTPDRR